MTHRPDDTHDIESRLARSRGTDFPSHARARIAEALDQASRRPIPLLRRRIMLWQGALAAAAVGVVSATGVLLTLRRESAPIVQRTEPLIVSIGVPSFRGEPAPAPLDITRWGAR